MIIDKRCKKCDGCSEYDVCWECSNPEEFVEYYYRYDGNEVQGLPPASMKQLYQPIDGIKVNVHRTNCEERLKMLQKVDFKGKNYLDLGCANGYFPLHIEAEHSLGIDHSWTDIVLAEKTRNAMKIDREKVRFLYATIDRRSLPQMMLKVDIVTVMSIIHHWLNKYGINAVKDMIRYIFTAKEVILEQGYIPKPIFEEFTGVKDIPETEYTMGNPYILNMMVKACIGFVPEFEVLGTSEYTQSNGVTYDRLMIHYKMEECGIRIHDDGQVNTCYKYMDRYYKYIPTEMKRKNEIEGNKRMGRDVQIHGDVISVPYIPIIKTTMESKFYSEKLIECLDRLTKAGIIHNEIYANKRWTGERFEPVDFEISVFDYDFNRFIQSASPQDLEVVYKQFDRHYFRANARELVGTSGMERLLRQHASRFAERYEQVIIE